MLNSTDLPDDRDTDRPPADAREATVTELEHHVIGELRTIGAAVVELGKSTAQQYGALALSQQRLHIRQRASEVAGRRRHEAVTGQISGLSDKIEALSSNVLAERRFRNQLDSIQDEEIEGLRGKVNRLSWVVAKAVGKLSAVGIAAAVAQYALQHFLK
jgi:hypothetical protein